MKLNEQQAAAVFHDSRSVLVLAGAGSGKTRVITARIQRLLDQGLKPSQLLAVTFTNKAAEEMRDRMRALVGGDTAAALQLSTFHSFGVRFIGEECRELGLGKRFSIFDQGDSLGLIRELMREHLTANRNLDAGAIASRISLWKNELLAPDQVRVTNEEYDRCAKDVFGPYQERLQQMHAVDFDDLVMRPATLLRDNIGVRTRWAARFVHVLVDEFQDTNRAQFELVRWLASGGANVCVVGDDDQAIYGWRGARVENILDFEKHFPNTAVTKLEVNYRSRAPILHVANAAISKSTSRRHKKVLRPAREGGAPVRLCTFPESDHEAKFVGSEIRHLLQGEYMERDIAVLYRSNQQMKLVEEELRVQGIAYRVYGGTKFFDRKEIKDAIAYLRLALNPYDDLSFRRIVNAPARGIGAESLRKLELDAAAHNQSLFAALERNTREHSRDSFLSDRASRAGQQMCVGVRAASRSFEQGHLLAATRSLLTSVGMLGGAGSTGEASDAETKRRAANLDFLLGMMTRLENRGATSRDALQRTLHQFALGIDNDDEAPKHAVTLSSLHSSKGLEFPVVFLIGCVEGTLPHSRTVDPKITDAVAGDIDEELRLFYVGVTRARDLLYLTRYTHKVSRGRIAPVAPSRFLDGLPAEASERYEGRGSEKMSASELSNMAEQLLNRLGAR